MLAEHSAQFAQIDRRFDDVGKRSTKCACSSATPSA
jgi:hypothetical protein